MRIISGTNKGRKIYAPKNLPVRPTTDQAKEALFNIISNNFNLSELSILDLFAGTGNLSYEFSSRGVKDVTCVDLNIKCINFIKSISNKLLLNIKVIKSDVFKFLKKNIISYDIIFADPPYDFEQINYEKIIQLIIYKQLLKHKGLLIIEHSKKTNLKDIQNYDETREYGGCCFSFFKI